jgi:hypothetical protein
LEIQLGTAHQIPMARRGAETFRTPLLADVPLRRYYFPQTQIGFNDQTLLD